MESKGRWQRIREALEGLSRGEPRLLYVEVPPYRIRFLLGRGYLWKVWGYRPLVDYFPFTLPAPLKVEEVGDREALLFLRKLLGDPYEETKALLSQTVDGLLFTFRELVPTSLSGRVWWEKPSSLDEEAAFFLELGIGLAIRGEILEGLKGAPSKGRGLRRS